MNKVIKIHPTDTVVVSTHDLKKGDLIDEIQPSIILLNDIPRGHKIALKDIDEDENVIRYGNPIGHATKPIKRGERLLRT